MTIVELEKLLKLVALIQAGATEVTKILANKSSQAGMTTEDILTRADKHTDEALSIINSL